MPVEVILLSWYAYNVTWGLEEDEEEEEEEEEARKHPSGHGTSIRSVPSILDGYLT
jgi:hypothetical protein